jgi:peroxiredoxin/mono/diheme cytochrome c family protein
MASLRCLLVLSVGFLTLLARALVGRTHADADRPDQGKPIPAFTLKDTAGHPVSLADYKDAKAVVIIFIGTECPINNAYMPRLTELHRAYSSHGVQFLAINSNQQDTPQRVAEHARQHGIPFPVLKDPVSAVADQFGAKRTPEAFVLDAERRIRYHGRIDDQFGVGYQRPKPTQRDLQDALHEVLEGKPVTRPVVPVAGCIIARAPKAKGDAPVTFTREVARILQKNCQECHRPDQIGPMPLLTYDDAAAWSETIREVVQERRMPPWRADPRYGKFENDRSLSKDERAALLAWIDAGCPKGDDRDLPAPRHFDPGWVIGTPDLILTMQEKDAFTVPAKSPANGIPYKYFEVPTNFKEDHWVVRAEARPGAPSVVHHIVIFIVPPGHQFIPEQGNGPVLCGTAPGDMPTILPPGTAKKIPAGSKLVFQMHYTPNGKQETDRSRVGLIFAKERPRQQVYTVAIANMDLEIPPGADNYRAESTFKFPADGKILNFMPHMHLRGKDFLYEAIYPDGRKETLLSVPQYNFNWQSVYRFATLVPMPKGSRIHCVAHYDNSAKNPNNPDPSKEVYWGDQTWEEMMIGWTDVVFDHKTQ